MEKSPSERKPNRSLRGRALRFAIGEAFGWRKTPVEQRDIGYEPVGIGAMDAGQLTIFNEEAYGQDSKGDSLPTPEEG